MRSFKTFLETKKIIKSFFARRRHQKTESLTPLQFPHGIMGFRLFVILSNPYISYKTLVEKCRLSLKNLLQVCPSSCEETLHTSFRLKQLRNFLLKTFSRVWLAASRGFSNEYDLNDVIKLRLLITATTRQQILKNDCAIRLRACPNKPTSIQVSNFSKGA